MMQPISPSWDMAIRSASRVLSTCEVWRDGARLETLTVSDGVVRVDETSATRRTLNVSPHGLHLGTSPLTPRQAGDLLAPYGTELRVWSGHQRIGGQVEMVPVGVFDVSSTARASWLSGLDITCDDRSRRVALARFIEPWNIAAGTAVTSAIRALLQSVDASWEVYDLTGSQTRTAGPVSFARGDDRLSKTSELAASIGAEVHLDATGLWIIRPAPTVGTPVWTMDCTGSRPAVLDYGQAMSSEGAYNVVVAYSSDVGGPPVCGYAYISSGPMSVASRGPVPYFFASPIGLDTSDQAVSAAAAMLPRVSQATRTIRPRVTPNRALDCGDTITWAPPDEEPSDLILSGMTFRLGPDPQGMTCSLRNIRITSTALTVTGVL